LSASIRERGEIVDAIEPIVALLGDVGREQ
jgi:hypothetical protein